MCVQLTFSQLPWTTHPDDPWIKSKKFKRKKKVLPRDAEGVAMRPSKAAPSEPSAVPAKAQTAQGQETSVDSAVAADLQDDSSLTERTTSTVDAATDTLTTSTPESAAQPSSPSLQKSSSGATQPPKTTPRRVAPAVPVVPVLPKDGAVVNSNPSASKSQATEKPVDESQTTTEEPEQPEEDEKPAPSAAVSWSALFKRTSAGKPAASGATPPNGTAVSEKPKPVADGAAVVTKPSSSSLADMLKAYEVRSNDKIYFIEPRALKNRGTDCYMNSVRINSP